MPDFGRPAELGRAQGSRITKCSGDIARNTCTREPMSHRLGRDRSRSVCDRFQPKSLPEFIDLVSLHANAVLLEARCHPDASDVARQAFRRNELCKNLGAGLIREPGDDVGVITECHDVTVTTNTTLAARQRQGGETPHGTHIQIPFRRDLERHGQKLRIAPRSTFVVAR